MKLVELVRSVGLEVLPDSAVFGVLIAFESIIFALFLALFLVVILRSVLGLIRPVRNGSSWLSHKTDPRIAGVFWRCCFLYFLTAVAGDFIRPELVPIAPMWSMVLLSNFVNVVLIMAFFRRVARLVDVCVGPRGLLRVSEAEATTIESVANIVLFVVAAILVLQALGADLSAILAVGGLGGIIIAFASRETAANLICYMSLVLGGAFRVGQTLTIFAPESFSPSDSTYARVLRIGPLHTEFVVETGTLVIPNRVISSLPFVVEDAQPPLEVGGE